jgi:hypothetical protein
VIKEKAIPGNHFWARGYFVSTVEVERNDSTLLSIIKKKRKETRGGGIKLLPLLEASFF